MRTKEDILKGKYVINTNGKEIVFNDATPQNVAQKIVSLYNSKQRIKLDYGNIETGESWNEENDIIGRVGLSVGYYNLCWPILVYNRRSMGGTSILTDCIIGIYSSAGGRKLL